MTGRATKTEHSATLLQMSKAREECPVGSRDGAAAAGPGTVLDEPFEGIFRQDPVGDAARDARDVLLLELHLAQPRRPVPSRGFYRLVAVD